MSEKFRAYPFSSLYYVDSKWTKPVYTNLRNSVFRIAIRHVQRIVLSMLIFAKCSNYRKRGILAEPTKFLTNPSPFLKSLPERVNNPARTAATGKVWEELSVWRILNGQFAKIPQNQQRVYRGCPTGGAERQSLALEFVG